MAPISKIGTDRAVHARAPRKNSASPAAYASQPLLRPYVPTTAVVVVGAEIAVATSASSSAAGAHTPGGRGTSRTRSPQTRKAAAATAASAHSSRAVSLTTFT